MMLFLVFFLAFNAYGQQKLIAIINTVDDDEPPIKDSDLNHLTDRLRAIANKTLPQRNYAVMTQQSILSLFATPGDMMSKCNELEGCLVKIGREIAADYICQGRIGRFDGNLTIKVELYESISGNLVSSFAEGSKNISGLLSILDEKAPDMFRRMLGVFGSPSIVRGISDLERAVDYLLDFEKHYLVNLTTDPAGASLSFNGLPSSSCAQSPCKVELPDGKVRIIAALEQYEIADTTVSLVRNNQSVSIKLKPNFGVLEIKPAYSDGLGRNEQWNLTINDKTVSSMENRLLPNKYKVKLSHRCYDDINFEVGINKGSYEVFDMSKYIKPKIGGLVLSTERDGEPSSEPVFVNGKNVGETPFSGSVALCADVELGRERVSAKVRLKHNETVRHTQKMPDSREWLAKKEEERRRAQETEAERRRREAEEYRARQIQEMLEDVERKAKRPIRLGLRLTAGGTFGVGLSSEWFDAAYIKDYDIGKSGQGGLGGFFALGLTLNIRITEKWVIATESNYNYFGHFDVYKKEDDNYIAATVSNHTMSIPVLLRFRSHELYAGYYFEAGYQWGFPFSSNVELEVDNSNGKFTDNRDFSEFRTKRDEALVFGLGMFGPISHSFGLRFIYHLTKLDKDGVVKSPTLIGITYAYNIF
ncbi:MAG: PEGA domain-containing protein [Fibromonadales bacterium]|nr:PEGA domain-containing protein [Fibromonadales bacterium]